MPHASQFRTVRLPLSKGETSTLENVQVLCRRHNSAKRGDLRAAECAERAIVVRQQSAFDESLARNRTSWGRHGRPSSAGGTDMSDAIVYVDTAEVREGALEEVKAAIKRLVDFVDANVPRLIAYNVYLSDDGARMTVVHVHPDSASLEFHMEVAGPVFRQFVELVKLSSIHVYGEPSAKVLKQLHEKARLLGRGAVEVEVDARHAGFTRFAVH
jgi:quinol monooxygenase YgiN